MTEIIGGCGRLSSKVVAAIAAVLLTAGGAAAQGIEDEYPEDSDVAYDDAGLYDHYEAGFDTANDNDDWFYDYYDYDADTLTTSSEDEWGTDIDIGDDVNEGLGDTDDIGGGDDVGDEGLFDW